MKTLKLYLAAIFTLTALLTAAQKKIDLKILESLPQNLELSNEIQKFKVTTTHYNGDIFGNFFNKQQICGEYNRGLANGKVKWNNVSFSQSMNREADFPEGTPIAYMEDFTYEPGEDMIKAEKFKNFGEYSDYTKNLVWDMLAIEGFAWSGFEKLQLNEPYSADSFNGKIDLAGQGFFENKDIQLTWTGISKRNGELCATIEYRTFNNPLEVKTGGMEMKGRSHYWGTIWVSLEDKQIEHAVLYEDVVMEMLLPGQTQKQIMNATREISFVREI
ncbi:hypothetical protein OU798_12755 [Prolixibacteraceae bacterium Z1-6]|uniref:DUF3108 domain-containing protein n=1 Tax=Draconibacterium aestuarii TaxID=2998507 RepID=A0A9X3FDW7_9BACT|nr:hypothetical protein [Prolixibacteraceae bacterium Z1-6]